jgi:hypothetical protein
LFVLRHGFASAKFDSSDAPLTRRGLPWTSIKDLSLSRDLMPSPAASERQKLENARIALVKIEVDHSGRDGHAHTFAGEGSCEAAAVRA